MSPPPPAATPQPRTDRAPDPSPGVGDASAWALDYAQQESRPFEPAPPGKVRIDLLTDPWSVWCWGWEPVRRTLALRYPSIEVHNLVGGMFEQLPDHSETGFDVERFFRSVQATTSMPIVPGAVQDDRPTSTYPACIHVHAMRLLAPDNADAFLRQLREAAYIDAANLSHPETAQEAARHVGIEAKAFEEALGTGEPEREFQERLALLDELDLHAYPTLLFTVGERTARVEGFQPLSSVITIAESLSGKLLPSTPPPELDAIIPEGERVATREVAEVLGTSMERAYDQLVEARDDGRLAHARGPTGDTWSRA